MQTLAQWRTHAKNLEAIVFDQRQRLQAVEAQLQALQATSAQTHDQLECALNEHTSLLQAAQAILGANTVDEICLNFISHMNSIVKADSTTLYLIDSDKQIISRSKFHRRPEASSWQLNETKMTYAELMAGLSGRVINTGQPLLSLNPEDGLEPPETLERRRQLDSGSLIIIPLVTTTGVIGTVTTHNRRTERVFTPQDVTLLMTLAHQAAAAIQRAQLTEEIKQLATTDSLTGLLSRRECLQLAQRELSRCQRLGRVASTRMFDIDHFKQINDTYGHPVGDAVLKGVSKQCLALQRPYDILGRYGGDEFLGFFPEAATPVARQIAERLCETVPHLNFPTDSGTVSVSLSVGIATSTGNDDTLETLIKRADQALYGSKQGGRNRVTIWTEPLAPDRITLT
jgi:diguanylate cyclase (GGDEF)-like protein